MKISLLAVLLVFVVGTGVIFAVPDAAGDVVAGKGEFRLGEVLDESVGWFIVVGLGMIFAGVISVEIKLEEKYLGHTQNSEWFNTAGRIIKTGLTAAAIVSAWTWAATLLQSSTVAYLYGISGPFWYASGATIQVLLFGILAIELKRKAPNAHTFLEIIRARFGNGTHKIFLGFALTCNMIVTGMLLLGGAAVVNGLTGMDITIAAFLATNSIGAVWGCCSPDCGVESVISRLGQLKPIVLIGIEEYSYNGKKYKLADGIKLLQKEIRTVDSVLYYNIGFESWNLKTKDKI